MDSNIYPKLPTAPPDLTEQERFNAGVVNSEFDELLKLKKKFSTKLERYKKSISNLTVINTGASAVTIGSGVSSIATGATLIGVPISVGLGGVALAGSICSGITNVLIKKYQNKTHKVVKLYDTVTSAIAVFKTSISRALLDGRIDYNEFQTIQGIYYKTLEKLSSTDQKMEANIRTSFEKSMLSELQNIKKTLAS